MREVNKRIQGIKENEKIIMVNVMGNEVMRQISFDAKTKINTEKLLPFIKNLNLFVMKATIIFALLLTFAMNLFGQHVTNHPSTREEYLLKSKEQKSTAWILLGLGTAAFVTGVVIVSNPDFDVFEEDLTGVSVLIIGGGLLDLISIPVFISASKNKKLGMQATTYLKIEGISPGLGYSPMPTAIPAMAINFSF